MRMRKRERIRRSGIGGSDIAAVFGLSPWKTRYALYLEKTAAPEEEIPPRPTGEHATLYWALQQKIDAFKKEGKKIPVEWIKNPFYVKYYRDRGMLDESNAGGSK